MKERLDILLVNKGLAPSREKAKTVIMAGQVFVDNQREDKAGSLFDAEKVHIEVRGSNLKYVSRGGLKLEKAFASFPLDLVGKVCMDIGASTGGFTDCMLQNGAAKVYAVDVGYGQLDWKLRNDERVVCMEKTNFRYLTPGDLPEQADFASCDVSFISLTRILLPAFNLLKNEGQMVCLIKPQFEAGREKVGKKGVVRDKSVHREVIGHVVDFADMIGFEVLDLDFSPIRGPEGNIEYLLYLKKNAPEALRTAQITPDDADTLTERQALERVHGIWEEKTGLSNREDWIKTIEDTVAAAHMKLDC
ncbi:MAG: TlyA family RNA methyltransferase [Lachnospiraceae bacterium]|nr:TlyA family RNA methyltransferase [Lachnospiraceae bacterium]